MYQRPNVELPMYARTHDNQLRPSSLTHPLHVTNTQSGYCTCDGALSTIEMVALIHYLFAGHGSVRNIHHGHAHQL